MGMPEAAISIATSILQFEAIVYHRVRIRSPTVPAVTELGWAATAAAKSAQEVLRVLRSAQGKIVSTPVPGY